MISSYFTLRYLASTLDSTLRGAKIVEAFSQDSDELVITFQGSQPHHLVVSCRPEVPTCYLHHTFARARRNTVDLLPKIVGSELVSVTIVPGDRVLRVVLDGGDMLAIHLFGPKANIFWVNTGGIIEDAFRNAAKFREAPYAFEQKELVYDLAKLRTELAGGPDRTILPVVKGVFPVLGSTLSEELLTRAGITPAASCVTLDGHAYERIVQGLHSILSELDTPHPRVYCSGEDVPVLFSLIPLQCAVSYRENPCENIHDGIRFFLSRRRYFQQFNQTKSALVERLSLRKRRTQRSLEAAEQELRQWGTADDYEEFGKLLLSHAFSIPAGHQSIELPGERGTVVIRLEPQLSAVKNAERYFAKSKKARVSRDRLLERIPRLRTHVIECDQFISLLETVHTKSELETMTKARGDEFGVGPKSIERQQIPFRVFTVDGGFTVWAGKSGANNDLLTLKHAKPNDLWFHVRGASGSHVVLKVSSAKGEPGRRAKEQAAAIAAYYSHMKTARTIPVAMTEKKYVRKPKGSHPGTVTIEREKVLFVEPALPKTADDADA